MQALEDLDYLAALDDDGNLSEVGIIMSELPLEPPLAKALIAACEYDCVDELLTIAAMLTGTGEEDDDGNVTPLRSMVTFVFACLSSYLLHDGGRRQEGGCSAPLAPFDTQRGGPPDAHQCLQRLRTACV